MSRDRHLAQLSHDFRAAILLLRVQSSGMYLSRRCTSSPAGVHVPWRTHNTRLPPALSLPNPTSISSSAVQRRAHSCPLLLGSGGEGNPGIGRQGSRDKKFSLVSAETIVVATQRGGGSVGATGRAVSNVLETSRGGVWSTRAT